MILPALFSELVRVDSEIRWAYVLANPEYRFKRLDLVGDHT